MGGRPAFDAAPRDFSALTVMLAALGIYSGAAVSGQATIEERDGLLAAMRARAEGTQVQMVDLAGELQFVSEPVFRYDDQPRGFVDATLWMWTGANGRPVAFQKIEAMERDGPPRWNYCFASFSERTLSARWPGGRRFQSTEPAVRFADLPGPQIRADAALRWTLQVRRIARRFAADIKDAATGDREQMRLLPRPIYEYELPESDGGRGAVLAFATYGTNPDLLFALETRISDGGEQVWQYAVVRMTNGSVTLRYDGREAWIADEVSSRDGVLPTWTFFGEPREETAASPQQERAGS